MKNRILYVVRGVPSSGKSSLADSIVGAENNIAADDYFYEIGNGEYTFDFRKLGDAHKYCQAKVKELLESGVPKVAVSNTSTRECDVNLYKKIGEDAGYRVFVLTCEKWHENTNSHGVPNKSIERMASQLKSSIKLK
jgi:predicted kinase